MSFKYCLMQNKCNNHVWSTSKTVVFHKSWMEVETTWLTACVSKVGLFKIRFVNYIHSGPKVKNKWVLLFAFFFFKLMISDVRTLHYYETRKMVKAVWSRCFSPISSTVATNAHHRKIQAVASCYWVYFPILNICCRKKCKNEKKKKKSCTCYPHCFPLSPSANSQTIFSLLSPLKTLE